MKNILLSIFVLSVCAFCACKKTNNGSTSVTITANVNGFPWVSTYATADLSKSPGTQITIMADSVNTHMKLHIGNYTGAGTYYLSDSVNTAYYISYDKATGPETHNATSGQIVVTPPASGNDDTHTEIDGTFNFTADAVTVKTGVFKVHLSVD